MPVKKNTLQTFHDRKENKGRSMVEMLGVLAIIGVLSVGGLAGYSMGMRAYKINQILNTIQTLAVNARDFFKNEPGETPALTQEQLVNLGLMNEIKLPGKGYFSIAGRTDRHFAIVLWYIYKKETCIRLATYNYGDKEHGGPVSMQIVRPGQPFNFFDLPITYDQAANACVDNAYITWGYKI